MPALQPPSMQIGGLPSGASTLTPQPAGPALAPAYQYGAPRVVQQVVAASTGAAQPTSATVTIAASTPGTLLVAMLIGMAQGGAQNTPIPTGFSTIVGTGATAGTSAADQWAYLPNNAGGITTVTWATLTNYSSYVAAVFELANVGPAPQFLAFTPSLANAAIAASTTTPGGSLYTPLLGSCVAVGLVGYQSTQTLTSTSTPASGNGAFTVAGASTSTNTQVSAVNTSATPYSAISSSNQPPPAPWQVKGTLGAAVPAGTLWVVVQSLASFTELLAPSRAIQVDQGAGYSSGDGGTSGWALGGTKPGGAGGGQ